MPQFCRHNRFVQNCPICRQPEAPAARAPRPARSAGGSSRGRGTGLKVRRMERAEEDGYEHELVPGLRASGDAARLADELAFAVARLGELATDPPGVYAEVAASADVEEAIWLAFLTAYLSPAEGEDAFAGIRAAHRSWAGGEPVDLAVTEGLLGPRTSHDPARGDRTVAAYRAWAARAGSQEAAIAGDGTWTPERRFQRVFERLSLPGLTRAARYDLLVTLGRLGVAETRPTALGFDADATTLAAKRVFGIGDTILLERRARALAEALDLPIETLDLALFNWAQPSDARATYGARVTAADGPREAVGTVLGA